MWTDELRKKTKDNTFWKKVVYTSEKLQIVLMNIPPQEEIGWEAHDDNEQLFYVEKGRAHIQSKSKQGRKNDGQITSHKILMSGDVASVPEGVLHNVTNPSKTQDLRLFTVYTPKHLARKLAIKVKP